MPDDLQGVASTVVVAMGPSCSALIAAAHDDAGGGLDGEAASLPKVAEIKGIVVDLSRLIVGADQTPRLSEELSIEQGRPREEGRWRASVGFQAAAVGLVDRMIAAGIDEAGIAAFRSAVRSVGGRFL